MNGSRSSSELEKLKKQIEVLEERLTSQDIIIDALVDQLKRRKKVSEPSVQLPDLLFSVYGSEKIREINSCESETERATECATKKEYRIAEDSISDEKDELDNKPDDKIENTGELPTTDTQRIAVPESALLKPVMPELAVPESSAPKPLPAPAEPTFVELVKEIFKSKEHRTEFKMNFTAKEFVEFAGNSYEYTVTNKKIYVPKNPQKQYIDTNIDKILKYILSNINNLSPNQLCSSLFLINSTISYSRKLVLFHDMVLLLDNTSLLLYLSASLFNNLALNNDPFSLALKSIIYHQFCIDTDLYNDDDIIYYLESIKESLGAEKVKESIWSLVEQLLVPKTLFIKNKVSDELVIDNSNIKLGFAIRMISNYLDWEYTYNRLIRKVLLPMIYRTIKNEERAFLIYILGILAMDGYRQFKNDESVTNVVGELFKMMVGCSESSLAAYLILKQRYEGECSRWYETNKQELEKIGCTDTVLNILLI